MLRQAIHETTETQAGAFKSNYEDTIPLANL